MEIFENKELFLSILNRASQSLNIDNSLLEKDYFVMFLLSRLNSEIPGLLFKGGTCCSRAYKVIDRFSEDIDLSLDSNHFGRNHNIKANKKVFEVCEKLGFAISNREMVEKHSHGSFNRYYVEYPSIFSSNLVKQNIQVEMAFFEKAYPSEIKSVNSIIGEWLINNNEYELANKYHLLPFEICVQKLERTFIDKVFAICDYYERKESTRNSRHIYDLHKISLQINLDDPDFLALINEVRNDRKRNERSLSAKDDYDINKTLSQIIETDFYKSDYNNITRLLLTKDVKYDASIAVLKTIIDKQLFKKR